MDAFEKWVEPHLPVDAAGDTQAFKGLLRERFAALANDAADILALGDGHINGAAQEIRDRLHPAGRP